MRTRPRRETRGVSRSKCADLITATVPVSWAASIIISESVDATDYYDGFGTGEIIIGIRAYQWGWEYFYPKTIDLQYNVSASYSSLIGNSLKYDNTSLETINSNKFWKFYQNKNNTSTTSTPSHVILSPSNESNFVNFTDFNDLGLNTVNPSNAFKHIQYYSKTNPQYLYNSISDFNNRYSKINNLYLNDAELNNSMSYGTFRQQTFTSLTSTFNNTETCLENKNLSTYLNYKNNLTDCRDWFTSTNELLLFNLFSNEYNNTNLANIYSSDLFKTLDIFKGVIGSNLNYSCTNIFNNRLFSSLNLYNLSADNYFPLFTEYADYDFLNWQSIESLEDIFWGSSYSSYIQDDVLNSNKTVSKLGGYKSVERNFLKKDRSYSIDYSFYKYSMYSIFNNLNFNIAFNSFLIENKIKSCN